MTLLNQPVTDDSQQTTGLKNTLNILYLGDKKQRISIMIGQ